MTEQSLNLSKITILSMLILTFLPYILTASCDRQRCCSLTTCTSSYCQQKNSQTWISSQNYDKYQYTKLLMSNNQCKPCPYNCKKCTTLQTCTQCYDGFYLYNTICHSCQYKCISCTVVNSVSKCNKCSDGTYLDTVTSTCKYCPIGAKLCLDSSTIIQCQLGYLKSSNSLFCTPCPSNCLSCPTSSSICSTCVTGYYINSGQCRKCNISNCQSCTYVSSTNSIYCTTCTTGYYRSSTITCSSCPSNCKTCTSSSVCTICNTLYYVQSGGCVRITNLNNSIQNCDIYSNITTNSINKCTSCISGYYVSINGLQCMPCSMHCASCYGQHFGRCTACKDNAILYNQMCLALPYVGTNIQQYYYTAMHNSNIFNIGNSINILICNQLLYGGTSISLFLTNMRSYKLIIKSRIFSTTASQSYTQSLQSISNTQSLYLNSTNNNTLTSDILFTSGTGYAICPNNSTSLYYINTNTYTYTNIKYNNTYTISSTTNIYISEIVVYAYRCSSLCIECSQNICYSCINQNLYKQDAYCVFACSQGYYIYQEYKQCVKQCPIGTYALLTNTSCMVCVQPCLTCLNNLYCLSCIQNYFLSTATNTCEQQCPYRYFGSVKTQKCQQCIGRCNQCTDAQNCTSCRVGFLQNGLCVDTCSNGYYTNMTTLKCQPCSPICSTCLYAYNNCITCPTGTLFYNNTCVLVCPALYYANMIINQCSICEYPCQNCTAANICTSCVDSYLLNGGCVSVCPISYYENNILLTCQACMLPCMQCYGIGTACINCISGYNLYNGTCISVCIDGYYPISISMTNNNNNNINICIQCVTQCKTCLNQTFCLECKYNYLHNSNNGTCVVAALCDSTYYADITVLKCMACDSTCMTCQYQSTRCTSCALLKVLYQGKCLSACPTQYYYAVNSNYTNSITNVNITIKVCSLCQEPCLTCQSQFQCLSCITGYKHSPSTLSCSSTCSIGSYYNKTINNCLACSTNCLTCNSGTFCYLCKSNTYINIINNIQNQCISPCPDLYYADTLACMPCLYPCQKCTTSIDCLSCQNGILYMGRCVSSCPQSTYLDTVNNTCNNCTGLCLTCKQEPNKCTLCLTGYYIIQQLYTCYATCPDGTYPFSMTKTCNKCPQSCSKCTNISYCTACVANKTYLIVDNHTCTAYCPSHYWSNSTTGNCQVCMNKCLTCSGAADRCLTCASGYLLVRMPNSAYDCLSTCPALYYNDTNTCYHCIFPCKQCISASKCLSCAIGMYYHSQTQSCLISCPLGTYYITNTNTNISECMICTVPCQTCTNSTNCISCNNGFYLHEGSCITACPIKYYADASGICNRCYGMCQTCIGKYQCITCLSGFSYTGYCYSACPPGTYASQQTKQCTACTSPCLQCVVNSTYCKRCQYNMFAYRGICSTTCPLGTYQSKQICQTCQFPCIKCNNQFTCQECIGGYLLYMKTSCIDNVQKCPNDLYKMDSKQCVPASWCPVGYYTDQYMKTCSKQCSREKYVDLGNRKCLDQCPDGQYVGQKMACIEWNQTKPVSLMGMNSIAFIKSSQIHIVIEFNQTVNWLQNSKQLYLIQNPQMSIKRLLSSSSSISSTINYTQTDLQQLILQIKQMPYSVHVTLMAHLLQSSSSNYNLQTPTIQVKLPQFTPYTYEQAYTATVMKQFSQGISWFIILFSMFFLFVNRLSDAYILWDTAQLLYLLVFLDMQYPPNLNDFLVGLSNIHFMFVPSIFGNMISTKRMISSKPFYAYSYDNSFLRTAGSPILLIVIAIAIYLLLKLTQLLSTKIQKLKQKIDQYPKIKNYLYKGILRYRWHHTSDIFFLSYDIIVLFAVAQIVNISKNPNNIPSNVVCIVLLVIYLVFPLFVSYKLYKHFGNISKGKLVANLQCFYRGIEKTNKFGVSLILIRYFRKLTYCIIIGVFTQEPMFAIPILMFTSVLMALFIFINKPFKTRLSNIITILTQVILVIVYILMALIQFGQSTFNNSTKIILGWLACGLLLILLLSLVYEIFCKTMFYLQPQKIKKQQIEDQKQKDLTKKYSQQYLRQKAGQFFDHIFPKMKQKLNFFEESEQDLNQYQKGDSQNSQNNQERQKNWGLMSESQEKRSDEFRHYGNNDQEESTTNGKKEQKPPNYLIRCVKQIH